jgi:hypothetical protein
MGFYGWVDLNREAEIEGWWFGVGCDRICLFWKFLGF